MSAALQLDDLAIRFGGVQAVAGVSFAVRSRRFRRPDRAERRRQDHADQASSPGLLRPDRGQVMLGGRRCDAAMRPRRACGAASR